MYLVNVDEEKHVVEASLGGRIDRMEMRVFGEELDEILTHFEGEPFCLVIDTSGAKPFDNPTQNELGFWKDQWIGLGAATIVNVVKDEDAAARTTSARLQAILEGKEQIVLDVAAAEIPELQILRARYRRSA